jgi:hypothetical protein
MDDNSITDGFNHPKPALGQPTVLFNEGLRLKRSSTREHSHEGKEHVERNATWSDRASKAAVRAQQTEALTRSRSLDSVAQVSKCFRADQYTKIHEPYTGHGVWIAPGRVTPACYGASVN